MKKIAAGVVITFISLILGLWLYGKITYPDASSIKAAGYIMNHLIQPHANMQKQVIGFLPYWRLEDTQYTKLHLMSEVNYFSLSVNKDGNIITVVNGETDPGWREWNTSAIKDFIAKTHIMGTQFTVTIAALQNDVIEGTLQDKNAQTTLIKEITELVTSSKLDGVNIDFEYQGEANDELQQQFTEFAQQLSKTFDDQIPNATLSISVMPLAARSNDIYDFPKIASLFDRFIVMSYDYYAVNSEIAGPVAPMTGFKENKFFFDVETTYEDYLKVIQKEKIVMGVPYYGWDRAVEDGATIHSKTFPQDDDKNYAAILSYARMRENKELKQNQCQWDDYALETWCWYTDKTGVDHQVWLQDNKSISIRYDFVNKQSLGGAAIWVLGYDKGYPDLWNLIKDKFTTR